MQTINVIDALIVNFYMDGYLDSFNDVSKAIASTISVATKQWRFSSHKKEF